jgi:DNA-binding NarL/FixJ family response regulator
MKKTPKTATASQRESIAIVDSQPSTRVGLTHFIKKTGRWEVIWASATAEEAMTKLERDEPDLMILDIQLTSRNGLEFIKQLTPLYPHLKILVHSAHSEEFYAERCLRAGAVGYIIKTDPMGNLPEALEKVLRGEFYLNPRIARNTLHSMVKHVGTLHADDHHLHDLTDRELEVMILMAQGDSCQDSAEKLHISPRTAQVHRNNIRLKIGLESALQLHAYAVRFYGPEMTTGHGAGQSHKTPMKVPKKVSAPVKNKSAAKRFA